MTLSDTQRPGTKIFPNKTGQRSTTPLNDISIDKKYILWFQMNLDLINYSDWYLFLNELVQKSFYTLKLIQIYLIAQILSSLTYTNPKNNQT